MSADDQWQRKIKGLLKAELKRRHVGYKELADKLGEFGLKETERNIANKIARGSFTAVFLFNVYRLLAVTLCISTTPTTRQADRFRNVPYPSLAFLSLP